MTASADFNTKNPLAGYTIAITAERRAEEFIQLLARKGATTYHVPTMHIIPLHDDQQLKETTLQLLKDPPEIVITSTGIGITGWLKAAAQWGLYDNVLAMLGSADQIISRGPKTTGALRKAGLRETWSPLSESSEEIAATLLKQGVKGKHIAIQVHGESFSHADPTLDLPALLTQNGAHVSIVSVYRWDINPQLQAIELLITKIIDNAVDAITFTSAPAVIALLTVAKKMNNEKTLLAQLNTSVPVFCVGPVTAKPLSSLGIKTYQPERSRLGSLARYLISELPAIKQNG